MWDAASARLEFALPGHAGVVTAVAPVGIAGPDDSHSLYRVEIYCDAPHGRPGAIRYSTHPIVSSSDPLLESARAALDDVLAVVWTVQWHRHDWIPDNLPIASLNLATDARAVLTSLDAVALPDSVEAQIPDYLPVGWTDERA